MGAAKSSNVADAVTNVANYVTQSTNANTTQVNTVSQNIDFRDCFVKVKNDFDIIEAATISVANNQIIQAKQDANLQNNIQQQMLQQATSKVGAIGIGYSDASNAATEMVNSTNSVVNTINAVATQNSYNTQSFTCDRSYIEANNLVIDFSSSGNFLSNQTVKNDQVAKIVNDVSQTVQQKATATVEGIFGLLIAILIVVAVIIYSVLKPLSSGGVKFIIMIATVLLLVGIMVKMYISSSPPFFAPTEQCISGSIWSCQDSDCINTKPNSSLRLKNPPLRFMYGVTTSTKDLGNLLQMAIAAKNPSSSSGSGGGDNGGYRMDTYNLLDTSLVNNQSYNIYINNNGYLGVPMVPNPLMNPCPTDQSAGRYYAIPDQYKITTSTAPGSIYGLCTPGTIPGVSNDVPQQISCNQIINPNNLNLTNDPSQGIALLNIKAWNDYLNMVNPTSIGPKDSQVARLSFARFVLADIVGNIDLHIYMQTDTDPIRFIDENSNIIYSMPGYYPDKCYKFVPDTDYSINSDKGITGPGKLVGNMGICNTKKYKIGQFMKKIGIYIFVFVSVGSFGYMFFPKKNSGNEEKPK